MMKELLAALDLETIPQISLGTAALLISAACAILAMLRGFLRLLTGSLILCASGIAGYLVWRHLPALGGTGISLAIPAIVALVVFLTLRSVLRFATRPFSSSSEDGGSSRRSPLRRVLTLLFSLFPASMLGFTGASAVRHLGSVAEIQRFIDGSNAEGPSIFVAELKKTIDRALPADWFKNLDPLTDDARVTLAKLIAMGDSSPPPKAIPVMEEPEIRDLVENDPKLRKLAQEKRYGEILKDPRLDTIMADPDLRKILADLKL
ncbi:hypothetical protein [Haloferula sp. BvORR071]|uniref:hypothetical protein n=1 Tax=Haloferula sp. BvORR071 TaxID=1396141 RepID=UPI00055805C8|nr:hypothetical protein [Haloferula sp. BvORR071]